jgi:hypothetical protein
MIVFNNESTTGTFDLVLRDKITLQDPALTLRLVKQDDFDEIEYDLVNVSTSNDYYTFTVTTNTLLQGDYIAKIYESVGATADCQVLVDESVEENTLFQCNPMLLEAELTIEATAVFSTIIPVEKLIYTSKARVEGAEYNDYYTYDQGPTYYVYNE